MPAARPRLVADIGGTNARFALQRPGERPDDAVTLRCAEQPGVEAAVAAALAELGVDAAPREAALAVAAPVLGDAIEMTNHPWRFSREGLRRALGLDRLVVVNDFTALALALPHLDESERRKFGGGDPVAEAPVAALGPGTGLGVSGLVPANGGWIPVAGEGGHVDLAPGDAREDAILERLRRDYGHVSLERVLSGPGLETLYRVLADIHDAPPRAAILGAAEIARSAGADGDRLCAEAVDVFTAILGAAAGDLALTLGARGGVYIAGGIVPRLGAAFDAALFRRRFEAKGRFAAYLEAIPTYIVIAPEPALRGLAALLDDRAGDRTRP